MSSSLWLLLYLAPLLGLTAAVFAWFGWQWRGSDLKKQIAELQAQMDDTLNALRIAQADSESAQRQAIAVPANTLNEQIENELCTLRKDLKSAQHAARLHEEQAIKAREASLALETETAKLLGELELLRKERDQAVAAQSEPTNRQVQPLEPEVAADVTPTLSAKPKGKRTATPKAISNAAILAAFQEKAATFAAVADDDLTQIKGIKKIINERLRAHGIRSWKQIAQWDDDELHAINELLALKNRATREMWREQARALHEAAYGPL